MSCPGRWILAARAPDRQEPGQPPGSRLRPPPGAWPPRQYRPATRAGPHGSAAAPMPHHASKASSPPGTAPERPSVLAVEGLKRGDVAGVRSRGNRDTGLGLVRPGLWQAEYDRVLDQGLDLLEGGLQRLEVLHRHVMSRAHPRGVGDGAQQLLVP